MGGIGGRGTAGGLALPVCLFAGLNTVLSEQILHHPHLEFVVAGTADLLLQPLIEILDLILEVVNLIGLIQPLELVHLLNLVAIVGPRGRHARTPRRIAQISGRQGRFRLRHYACRESGSIVVPLDFVHDALVRGLHFLDVLPQLLEVVQQAGQVGWFA